MTLPIEPTERDRERFRDMAKAIGLPLEFDRVHLNDGYRDASTQMAWRLWWAQERERQLLQNLNQSQGAEITRLMNKTKQLEAV